MFRTDSDWIAQAKGLLAIWEPPADAPDDIARRDALAAEVAMAEAHLAAEQRIVDAAALFGYQPNAYAGRCAITGERVYEGEGFARPLADGSGRRETRSWQAVVRELRATAEVPDAAMASMILLLAAPLPRLVLSDSGDCVTPVTVRRPQSQWTTASWHVDPGEKTQCNSDSNTSVNQLDACPICGRTDTHRGAPNEPHHVFVLPGEDWPK